MKLSSRYRMIIVVLAKFYFLNSGRRYKSSTLEQNSNLPFVIPSLLFQFFPPAFCNHHFSLQNFLSKYWIQYFLIQKNHNILIVWRNSMSWCIFSRVLVLRGEHLGCFSPLCSHFLPQGLIMWGRGSSVGRARDSW